MVDRIKGIFRSYDRDGTGLINVDALANVLVRVGLSATLTDKLLRDLPNDQQISYDAFCDSIFDTAPTKRMTREPQWKTAEIVCHRTSGTRNLLRALKTLTKGRLRHAADPWAALKNFSTETALDEALHSSMRDHLTALQRGDPLAFVGEEAEAWEKFARWCVEQLLLEVFEVADLSSNGTLSMQELMVLLMILAAQRNAGDGITPQDAEQVVREFDLTGDGALNKDEFSFMVHALEREADLWADVGDNTVANLAPPHLVLNFDLNNTVLIADSLTGADASKLISMTLAGATWGIKKLNQKTGEAHWVLVDQQPRLRPLWEGLTNYAKFISEANPIPKQGTFDEKERVKDGIRKALQAFCEPGQPGEGMRPHMDDLLGDLKKASCTKLLPSFYFLLQQLKRMGRSFSVCFRTFGVDMDEHIEKEFNAFCEGRCPYFSSNGLVLDGSDGGHDHRMNLGDQKSIGTFFRRAEDNTLYLVWGTHQQPQEGQGLSFFDTIPGVRIVEGVTGAAASLWERFRIDQKTLVLRDHYRGWAKQGFTSKGGKPIFINIEDDSVFSVMFDDHAQPQDPTIIDAVQLQEYPLRMPMAQVYDIHIVKATPLRSISEVTYFWEELQRCEKAKLAQLSRRRKVARLLHDVEAIRRAIVLLGGAEGHECSLVHDASCSIEYHGWKDLEIVKNCAPLLPDATDDPCLETNFERQQSAEVERERIESRGKTRSVSKDKTIAPSVVLSC